MLTALTIVGLASATDGADVSPGLAGYSILIALALGLLIWQLPQAMALPAKEAGA